MIKILWWNDWKKINAKLKEQRESMRTQRSLLLEQEREIAELRATIVGLNAEIETAEKETKDARVSLLTIQKVIEQKATPTQKIKEILLILE